MEMIRNVFLIFLVYLHTVHIDVKSEREVGKTIDGDALLQIKEN